MNSLKDAYQLFHDGVLALSTMEDRGICIDVPLLYQMEKECNEGIIRLNREIRDTKEAKLFEKINRKRIDVNSDKDLYSLLYDVLKMPVIKTTDKGNYSIDAYVLGEYSKDGVEIAEKIMELRKIEKTKNTYLAQIKRYIYKGKVHPEFHLHFVVTYRSSSSSPNLQNIPKRDEEMGKIRRLFIPTEGNILGSVDYGGIEVRVIACLSKDSVLCEELWNGDDIHGVWANMLFNVDDSHPDWKSKFRYNAKNKFVFPLFYGSYYKSCALNLNLPIRHVQKCEKEFWNKYKGVKKWIDNSLSNYQQNGYVNYPFGFCRRGYIDRNQIINTPVQGTAFHMLLWSIVQEYKTCKWENSWAIGEIHDEIIFDINPKEKNKLEKEVSSIMCDKIREENPWIIVPLIVEWEFGKNLGEMKENT